MDQLPNMGREDEMLKIMGFKSIDDLFSDIPENVRFSGQLPLRGPQSEAVSYTHLTLPTSDLV